MKIESDCSCRHCTSRNETCHAACLDYAEFKAKREIMLDSIRAEKYDYAARVRRRNKHRMWKEK